MINAIGSPAYSSSTGAGASTVGLEAQLANYQKALSESVNCDSAKTREGKTAIDEISCKIGEIKARIEKITLSKPSSPVHDAMPPADITENRSSFASEAKDSAAIANTPASGLATAIVGSRLDVFA